MLTLVTLHNQLVYLGSVSVCTCVHVCAHVGMDGCEGEERQTGKGIRQTHGGISLLVPRAMPITLTTPPVSS